MLVNELVYSMLIESTGTHFLDSGGDNNRHWQKNRLKSLSDFESEESVSGEWWVGYGDDPKSLKLSDIDISISIYHYLSDIFDLDDICQKFNQKYNVMDNFESEWNFISDDAQEYLESLGFEVVESKINTCNYDNFYSQDMLYARLKLGEDEYYLLSIHNGADIRGGYTDAKLFKLNSYVECPFATSVYGTVGDCEVSTMYNGYSLTIDGDEYNDDIVFNVDTPINLEYIL